MKWDTGTIPDDLAAAGDRYIRAQEAPPALTAAVQTALRVYLTERGYLRAPGLIRKIQRERRSV